VPEESFGLTGVPLAPLTTLRLGGPARRLIEVHDEAETVEAVRGADARGDRVLVLAGGSNVVLPDAGVDATVVLLRSSGVHTARAGDAVDVTVAAGHDWDDLVARCVADRLVGVECLSGIPGSTGATPVQNVGAYGQEVADTLVSVRAYDRRSREVVTMTPAQCRFSYRHSVFKGDDRYLVLAVTLRLRAGARSAPLRFGELTSALGVEAGGTAPLEAVRDAVLTLRRRKGMVLDPSDHDTWSVGSFFTNPVLDDVASAALADRCAAMVGVVPPGFDAGPGLVKTSAAWLIERAGFEKGYGHDGVAVSTKHTLALTNRGTGTTAALLALAREVRDGVAATFGVQLVNEPLLVDAHL